MRLPNPFYSNLFYQKPEEPDLSQYFKEAYGQDPVYCQATLSSKLDMHKYVNSEEFDKLQSQVKKLIDCIKQHTGKADIWDTFYKKYFVEIKERGQLRITKPDTMIVMYSETKQALEQFYYSLETTMDPTEKERIKDSIYNNLLTQQQIEKCPEGANSNFEDAKTKLKTDLFFPVRTNIIRQLVVSMLREYLPNLNIFVGMEVHYVNTITNELAKKYGLKAISDGYATNRSLRDLKADIKIPEESDFFKVVETWINIAIHPCNIVPQLAAQLLEEYVTHVKINQTDPSASFEKLQGILDAYGKDSDFNLYSLIEYNDEYQIVINKNVAFHLQCTLMRRLMLNSSKLVSDEFQQQSIEFAETNEIKGTRYQFRIYPGAMSLSYVIKESGKRGSYYSEKSLISLTDAFKEISPDKLIRAINNLPQIGTGKQFFGMLSEFLKDPRNSGVSLESWSKWVELMPKRSFTDKQYLELLVLMLSKPGSDEYFILRSLEKLLSNSDNEINATYLGQGETLLHLAAKNNYSKTVDLLLLNGARTDIQVTPLVGYFKGFDAFDTAIDSDASESLESFLKNSASFLYGYTIKIVDKKPNLVDIDFGAIYVYQDSSKQISVSVRGLDGKVKSKALDLKDDLFSKDISENIKLAVSGKNAFDLSQKAIEYLHIEATGKNSHALFNVDAKGRNVLFRAAASNSPQAIQLFLAQVGHDDEKIKALLNQSDKSGDTPLIIAARKGNLDVVMQLLRNRQLDVHKKNNKGESCLFAAAQSGKKEVFLQLLQYSLMHYSSDEIQSLLKDTKGNTVLHAIVNSPTSDASKNEMIIQLMESRRIDINALDANKNSALYLAAIAGNIPVAKVLLKHGGNVNLSGQWGDTPLTIAGRYGCTEFIKFLFNHSETDVNALTDTGSSVLHRASGFNHLETVKFLCEYKRPHEPQFDIHLTNKKGESALFQAVEFGHVEVAKYLISRGLATNVVNIDHESLLHIAIKRNNPAMVDFLIEHHLSDLDIHAKNKDGETAFFLACKLGYTGIARRILQIDDPNKKIINAKNNKDQTALEVAIRKNEHFTAKFLIESGAGLTFNQISESDKASALLYTVIKNCDLFILTALIEKYGAEINHEVGTKLSNTPLLLALQEKHFQIAKYLINKRARLDIKFNEIFGPLYYAVKHGQSELVELLLNNGVSANNTNDIHKAINPNYLLKAIENDDDVIAEMLLKAGASATPPKDTLKGETLLVEAIKQGRIKIAILLCDYRAEIDVPDSKGNAPLILAVEKGNHDLVEKLLLVGADANVRENTYDKKSLLRIAVENKDVRMAEIIIKYCGQRGDDVVNQEFDNNNSLFCKVVESNNMEMVKLFLENHVSIKQSKRSHNFWTNSPFIIAAECGFTDILMLLLEKEHNPICRGTFYGDSLLGIAIRSHHLETAKALVEKQSMDLIDLHLDKFMPVIYTALDSDNISVLEYCLNELKVDTNVQWGRNKMNPLQFMFKNHNRVSPDFSKKAFMELIQYNPSLIKENTLRNLISINQKNYFDDVIDLVLKYDVNNSLTGYDEKSGKNACHLATEKGDIATLQKLLERNRHLVNLPTKKASKMTPLMLAVKEGKLEAIKLLLDYDADVNARTATGNTALHEVFSLWKNGEKIALLLLDKKKDSIQINEVYQGKTPLQKAIEKGYLKLSLKLIELGAHYTSDDLNLLNNKAQHSQDTESKQIISKLYEKMQMLYSDIIGQKQENLDTILSEYPALRSVFMNISDHGFGILLHLAILAGNQPAVKTLLKHKLDVTLAIQSLPQPTARSQFLMGRNVIDTATVYNQVEVVHLLLNDEHANASFKISDYKGGRFYAPYLEAVRLGNFNMTKIFLQHPSTAFKEHVDDKDPDDQKNALWIAIEAYNPSVGAPSSDDQPNNHKKIVIELLENYNANPMNLTDKDLIARIRVAQKARLTILSGQKALSQRFLDVIKHDVNSIITNTVLPKTKLLQQAIASRALIREDVSCSEFSTRLLSFIRDEVRSFTIAYTSCEIDVQQERLIHAMNFISLLGSHHKYAALKNQLFDEVISDRLDMMMGGDRNKLIRTCLLQAIENGDSETLDKLMSKYDEKFTIVTSLVAPDRARLFQDTRISPLHLATAKGSIEIVQMLVEKYPSKLNVLDSLGHSPLYYAVLNAREDVVDVLLKALKDQKMDPTTLENTEKNPQSLMDLAKSRHGGPQNEMYSNIMTKLQKRHEEFVSKDEAQIVISQVINFR